jgi:hypothetical protein
LKFQEGSTTITLDNLTIVSADAIYSGPSLDDETIYLVTIADTRVFLKRTVINQGFNVFIRPTAETNDDPPYHEDTLNSGDPYTWEEVVDEIWGLLPPSIAGTLDVSDVTFPTAYTPQDLCFYGITAWDALFICLDKLGFLLALYHDGTYKLYEEDAPDDHPVGTFTGQTDYAEEHSFNRMPGPINYPESVTVFFPNLGNKRPLYSKNVTTVSILPSVVTRSGVVDILHDTANAYYDGAGVITNDTDLDAIAVARVTSYLNGLNRPADLTISNGLLNVYPNAQYDSVAWYDHGKGLRTELHTRLRRKTGPKCSFCVPTATLPTIIVYIPYSSPPLLPQDLNSEAYGYLWTPHASIYDNIDTSQPYELADYFGSIGLPGSKLQVQFDSALNKYIPYPPNQNSIQLARTYKRIEPNTTVSGDDIYFVAPSPNDLYDDVVELSELLNAQVIYEWTTSNEPIEASESQPAEIWLALIHEGGGCNWRIIGRACNPTEQ